jgi:hypothetical protein
VTSLEPVGFTFPDPVAVCIHVIAVPEPKTVKNRVHIGLATTSAAHQATLVARFLDFGTMLAAVGGRALGDGGDHREGVVGGAVEITSCAVPGPESLTGTCTQPGGSTRR